VCYALGAGDSIFKVSQYSGFLHAAAVTAVTIGNFQYDVLQMTSYTSMDRWQQEAVGLSIAASGKLVPGIATRDATVDLQCRWDEEYFRLSCRGIKRNFKFT
jgi:hypothetical protein